MLTAGCPCVMDMVVSINRETPIYTPKYYNPYNGDPPNGTPNFRKPHIQEYVSYSLNS